MPVNISERLNSVDASAGDSSPWQSTAGATTAVAGEKWIIEGAHTLNLPAGPANFDTVILAPGNLDWSTLGASIATTDTATVGAGQAGVLSNSERVEFVYDNGADNWRIFL